jgi:NAD-dependent SIR2 family protein deacetylase
MKDELTTARKALNEAEAVLICAGAGMGVDSGLPDFRGDEGFWKAYPEAERLGLRFVELANPAWFDRDPALAWAFYGSRYQLYADVRPHGGFDLLLELVRRKGDDSHFVFTSNVDGHFQLAGFDEERIAECHGSLHFMQCSKPCRDEILSADLMALDIDMEAFRADNYPLCENCGAVMRPNVLMFGDWGWVAGRTARQEKRFEEWRRRVRKERRRLVIIEMGAGLAVPTVRLTSEGVARENDDSVLIRINPREPQTPPGHISLAMGALEALEKMEIFHISE